MRHLLRITTCCLLAAFASLATGCKDDEPQPVTPPGGGDAITVTARYALGTRTENAATDQSTSYRIAMSESAITGTAEAPKLAGAGNYVTILLYGAETQQNTLPEGTYQLVDGTPSAGQGGLNACRLETTDAQGNPGTASQVLLGGSVKVSHTTAGYKIELSGQLSGERTLTCVYEGAIDFSSDGPIPDEYDITLNAQFSLGMLYSEVAEDGSSDFYITLSDIEMDGDAEEPFFGEAGHYFSFDLVAIEQEPGMLPEGTYVFTAEDPVNMAGMLEYSGYNTTDEFGEPTSLELQPLASCTAVVSYTDDGYKIVATGALEDGRTFRCEYEGMIDLVEVGGGGDMLPGLEGDVSTTFTIQEVAYHGLTQAGTAHYSLNFYDNDINAEFKTTNRLTLDLFTAASENPLQQIAAGTYNVEESLAASTIMTGSFNTNTLQVEGSYCEQSLVTGENYSLLYGLVQAGSVKIELSGAQYTVTANLTDTNGNTIQGTYNGTIDIEDVSFDSTLTGDKQVDLAGKTCEIGYWGNYYNVNGDNWSIFIYTPQEVVDGVIPADGSEAFQIELIAPTGSYADGLPAGEYAVAALDDYTPGNMICLPGRNSRGDLYESWYLGEFQGNAAYAYAPFVRGKVNVARTGAQYTITVDVYDDAKPENRITATWTGSPVFENGVGPSSAQRSMKQRGATAVSNDSGVTARRVQIRKNTPKHPRW